MDTIIRKVGNSLGIIIPDELNAKTGDQYKIIKIGDSIVLTLLHNNLFENEAEWKKFRDSISAEDYEWDRNI